jgi:hypothetical protein
MVRETDAQINKVSTKRNVKTQPPHGFEKLNGL